MPSLIPKGNWKFQFFPSYVGGKERTNKTTVFFYCFSFPPESGVSLTQNTHISDNSGHQMNEVFPPHQVILCDTGWVSYNLIRSNIISLKIASDSKG